MMQKHIKGTSVIRRLPKKWDYKVVLASYLLSKNDGSIGEVRMRGPHEVLETEASRIISKLPRMDTWKAERNPS